MHPFTAVQRSLPAFSSVPTGSWAEMEATVVRAGVPPAVAAEVIAIAPIAFGRVVLDGMGIEFSPDYATPESAAEGRTAGSLVEHPMYVGAHMMASGMMGRQAGGDVLVSTALWSPEFSAINQALNAGSNPSDLVVGPPLITGLGDGPGSADAAAAAPDRTGAGKKRPCWRVWG